MERLVISDEEWVLSLVRKGDGAHPEHAFLVLEGIDKNRSMIWFMDFVENPGRSSGKIRICSYKDNLSTQLLFACDRQTMDIRKSDRIIYKCWQIPKEDAQQLVSSIIDKTVNKKSFDNLEQSIYQM